MMKVIEYDNSHKRSWDRLLERSENGTIFHTHKFLSYHPAGRFDNYHLIIKRGSKYIGLLTGNVQERDGKRIFRSYQGASYGGFILEEGLGISKTMDAVAAVTDFLKGKGFDGIYLTQPPVIYHSVLNHHIDFALVKNGFREVRHELSSVVTLEDKLGDNFAKFKATARTATRRSMKQGVQVRLSDDWAEFYSILKKNLKMRHDVTPTHSLDELVKLSELFPEDIFLFGAYQGDTLVAGVVIFVCNPRVILAFYISHDETYQELRPVNLLFYNIMDWGIKEDFRELDFGIYTVDMDPNYGLARFKESFGAHGVFRKSFEIIFDNE